MDKFEEASNTIMPVPGDWYTGLNTAQSIFKCFWKPLLSPIMDMLGWKRINEKERVLLYQASRLIKLINRELHRYMMHRFASEHGQQFSEMFNKAESTDEVHHDLDILCAFGNRYQEWLRQMEDDKNPDQYEQVCALFLQMSYDFQLFLDSIS